MKLPALLLALALCFGLVPVPMRAQASAADQARLDGGYAAGAQYAIDVQKTRAEQGTVTKQVYEQ